MKRMLSILIAVLLSVSVLAGCGQNNGDKAQFDFSYSVERPKYSRGESIRITATVTNISGRMYRYVGCSGEILFDSRYGKLTPEVAEIILKSREEKAEDAAEAETAEEKEPEAETQE